MVNTNRIPSLINYSHWKRPKVTKYYNWVKRHKREPQGEYGECDGGLTEKGRRKLSRRGGGTGGLLGGGHTCALSWEAALAGAATSRKPS